MKSLYTNIPNDEGIKACIDMLKEYNTISPEVEQSIFNILTLILNKNSFSFNNEDFLQIHGTDLRQHIHGNPRTEASKPSTPRSYG